MEDKHCSKTNSATLLFLFRANCCALSRDRKLTFVKAKKVETAPDSYGSIRLKRSFPMARLSGRGSCRPRFHYRKFSSALTPSAQTFSRFSVLTLFILACFALFSSLAIAQNQTDDVHINPRIQPEQPKDPLATIDPAL